MHDDQMKRGFQGIWIPAEIWENEELLPMEKLIWAEINSFSAQGGCCFMSNEVFADHMKIGKSTLIKMISHLQELGYIDYKFDGRKRYLKSNLKILPKGK